MPAESKEDFLRKYGGCYATVKETGEIIYIAMADEQMGGAQALSIVTPDHGEVNIKYSDDAIAKFNLDFPATGFFQHGKWAYFLVRGYQRQFVRGLSNNTASILNPLSYFGRMIKVPQAPKITFETAASIHNRARNRVSISEGITQLVEEKKNSVRLAKSWALSLSHASNGYILWNEVSPVAEVFPDDKKIVMVDTVFQQETEDYLNRTGDKKWQIKTR